MTEAGLPTVISTGRLMFPRLTQSGEEKRGEGVEGVL